VNTARRLNVAIVGDTGVGKSSLVNAIFNDQRAATGIGAPVTEGAEYHVSHDGTVGVWDFGGFEHGGDVPPLDGLRERLAQIQSGSQDQAIAVAWFCWDASSARVTDGHRALIAALVNAGVPVVGVLTKVLRRGDAIKEEHSEFAQWIEGEDLGLADPQVYVTAVVADPDFGVEVHGLAQLLRATSALASAAPEELH